MRQYNLEERTLRFAVNLLKLIKNLPANFIDQKIILQLTSSATSIGANYMEAIGAESKRDFCHKIFISLKEMKETRYWLKILKELFSGHQEVIATFIQEAHELVLIFSKIASNSKG